MPSKPTKSTIKKTTKTVAPKKETIVKKVAKPVKAKVAVEAEKVKKPTAKPVASELVKKYRNNAEDTGSIAVQISRLTERIQDLSKHLAKHIHDFDSKRGLLILVGKRRRLLNYMREHDEKNYSKLIQDLKLKK